MPPTIGTDNRPMSAHQNPGESLEHAGLSIELAAAAIVRVVEVAAVVILSLLVCPPLAILAIVVALPLVALAAMFAIASAIAAVPFLLVRRLRGRRDHHTSLVLHRLRRLRGVHA